MKRLAAPPRLSRWLEPALHRPVLAVAGIALLLRTLALAHVPLVITNDGVGYAMWAETMLHGGWPDLPIFRTPGYPLLLAGAFGIGGVGPWPVLVLQHAMGIATCALIAATAARIAGRWAALGCGLLAALDMRMLGFESYLLSETPATFLFVLAVALALDRGGARQPAWRAAVRGAALGATLAALCLTRPAFQITVPFLAAAILLSLVARPPADTDVAESTSVARRAPRRQLALAAVALAITLGGLLTPWIAHNAGRGIRGLSGAGSVFFWLGARQAGLLEGTEPPERVRPHYERLLAGEPPHSDRVYPFLVQSGAWSDHEARRALSAWTREAIAADPGRYAVAAARAGLWQLDIAPAPGPSGELRWFMRRLAVPPPPRDGAPNFQFDVQWAGTETFAMRRPPGPMARVIAFTAGGDWSGVLNALLAACAAVSLVASLIRRRWAWALILAAGAAYLGAHAIALLPSSRFGLPIWASWYIAPALLIALRPKRP